MSEQSELAKVLKTVYRDLTDGAANGGAKQVLDHLAEARKKKWSLVPVSNSTGDQEVSALEKTDFKSLLAIFMAGKWVGYLKPGTKQIEVCILELIK